MSISGVQSGPDETLGLFSREKSVVFSDKIADVESRVRGIYDVPQLVDFLALTQVDHVSAATYPLHGLVGINPRIFADKPEYVLFLGVHESVHAKLGDAAVVRSIDPAAPGLREYFHKTLVPAWLNNEVSFRSSQAYMLQKGYEDLMPEGRRSRSEVTPDVVQSTTANYFAMAARGFVLADDYSGFMHPSPFFSKSWQEALGHPTIEPSELAEQQGKQVLADVAITGFEVSNRLRDYTSTEKMWMWEEGVANLIASDLTGLSLEEAQSHMYQDEFKIKIARQLVEAGVKGKELAERVQSYQDLEELVQEFER